MDYSRPDVWESLATSLTNSFVPRPSQYCNLVECEPGWSWRWEITDYDAWLVLAGRGHARVGDLATDLQPGSLLLLRPGDEGMVDQHSDDRLTVVYCHFDFFSPLTGELVRVGPQWLPSRHIRIQNLPSLDEPMRRLVKLSHDPHPLTTVERATLLLQALLCIYREDAYVAGHAVVSLDPRIHEVVSLVRRRPGLRTSLRMAAETAGLSTVHFSRLFTRDMGMSYRQFVLETRLERARHLLTETAMNIGAIAHALGYQDQHLFSRQIHQHYDQSPTQLRAQGRNR